VGRPSRRIHKRLVSFRPASRVHSTPVRHRSTSQGTGRRKRSPDPSRSSVVNESTAYERLVQSTEFSRYCLTEHRIRVSPHFLVTFRLTFHSLKNLSSRSNK